MRDKSETEGGNSRIDSTDVYCSNPNATLGTKLLENMPPDLDSSHTSP
jgi:hypothetical protein